MDFHRRAFLFGAAGATILGGGSFAYMRRWGRQVDPGPHPQPYESRPGPQALSGPPLDPRAERCLGALVGRLLPATAGLPGGAELGVLDYLRRALAEPGLRPARDTLLKLSRSLDLLARQRGHEDFATAPEADQDALIAAVAAGQGARGRFRPDRALKTCLQLCLEGYLSHPVHGGNREAQAWAALNIRMPRDRGPFHYVKDAPR